MTSIAEAADSVVGLARGMRELVHAEAAESGAHPHAHALPIVEEMWASGLMSAFNPVAGRRCRAVLLRR